jgi:iron complex transport system substrate-binding protein
MTDLERTFCGVVKLIFLFFLFTIHFSLFTVSYAAEPPKRIISLAPATTEMLFALGLGDRVVGVTNFCDYPDGAKKKPKVGGMSNPSLEAVVSLKPDLVILSVDGNPKEFDERLRAMKIKTYVIYSNRISELPKGIRDMGLVLGVKDKADALAADMEHRINKLKVVKKPTPKKKVLFIIWPEPLMVAGPGSITDDALQMLGAENIAGKTASAYPKYSLEEVIRRAPDIIFIGKGQNSMNEVSEGLLKRLQSTPAAKNNKVFYVSDYLYRLGPRTLKGIEELEGYLRQ